MCDNKKDTRFSAPALPEGKVRITDGKGISVIIVDSPQIGALSIALAKVQGDRGKEETPTPNTGYTLGVLTHVPDVVVGGKAFDLKTTNARSIFGDMAKEYARLLSSHEVLTISNVSDKLTPDEKHLRFRTELNQHSRRAGKRRK